MPTISKSAVRASIDFNERDLAEIDRRRNEFRGSVAILAKWARSSMRVPPQNIPSFLAQIDDALGDLFFEVERDISEDVENDKRLIGDAG